MIIAVEILGPIDELTSSFLYDLRRRISLVSGEDRKPQFLFQCISCAVFARRFLSSDHAPGLVSAPDFNFLQ